MTLSIKCKSPVSRGQGIKYIDIDQDDRTKLIVHFLEPAEGELTNSKNYVISGGSRINVRVKSVDQSGGESGSDCVVLQLDREGDFSIYKLTISKIKTLSGRPIDPFFATKEFSFKKHCSLEFDCRKTEEENVETTIEDTQVIDYMAKDYESFRRALIDLIPSKTSFWKDASEADFGIVMLELFSHLADQLSYYQDRVANEAFLKTATQRTSVKYHADLIDYKMHNGASATTYIFFEASDIDIIPQGFPINGGGVVFELDGDILIDQKFNAMKFYTWGNRGCYLPKGSTEAVLWGDFSDLKKGDPILIKDTRKSEDQKSLDSWRREIVHLTEDPGIEETDPFDSENSVLTTIKWSEPLRYEYGLDDGETIVCGNIARASHGSSKDQDGAKREETLKVSEIHEIGGKLTFTLKFSPLTYLNPIGNLRKTKPAIDIFVDGEEWERTDDILGSGRFDHHYTVTTDNEGYGVISFGNGIFGQKPPDGSEIRVLYRVGCGTKGNVGMDTLNECEIRSSIRSVTNPLPASGGVEPESMEEVKMNAPKNIKRELFMYMAITPEDYELAAKNYTENGVKVIARAKATFVWTGSWNTVFVSVDPIGTEELSDELKNGLEKFLNEKKLAGYDLKVVPAVYVPLYIKLKISVNPDFFVKDVRESLNQILSNRTFNGKKGFFHPDNFTFGDSVFASRLYYAVKNTPGVDFVDILSFKRLREPAGEYDTAKSENLVDSIPIGEFEIMQLENDRNFPEKGILKLEFDGGK